MRRIELRDHGTTGRRTTDHGSRDDGELIIGFVGFATFAVETLLAAEAAGARWGVGF